MRMNEPGRVVIYMLFPMTFFLLPAIFLMLGGPAVLKMVKFFRETMPTLESLDELRAESSDQQ